MARPKKTRLLANVRLDQQEALERLSAQQDVPVTELIRRAIDLFLATQKPPTGSTSTTFMPGVVITRYRTD